MKAPLPFQPGFKRYSERPFPPYHYIPGLTPRPGPGPQPSRIDEQAEYLYAVDLYNFNYWWEAHEAWETVWQTTQKTDERGQFLQGLIQISAGMIKWWTGQEKGRKNLFDAGMERLRTIQEPIFMGLDVERHIQKIEQFLTTLKASDYPLIELDNLQKTF